DARPYGHHLTTLPNIGLTGTTEPGATVRLVEANLTTTAAADGTFSFTGVALANPGDYTFTAIATDVAGNAATTTLTVTRLANQLNVDLLRPVVTLGAVSAVVNAGDAVTIQVTATDNVGVASVSLQVNGRPVPLDAFGRAVYTPGAAGIYSVV